MRKLLRPGLHLKRWFGVLLLGMVFVCLGIAYVLTEMYRSAALPEWVGVATLQFLPLLVRGGLFLLLGGALCGYGFLGLYRALAWVLPANSNQSLLERLYEVPHAAGRAADRLYRRWHGHADRSARPEALLGEHHRDRDRRR